MQAARAELSLNPNFAPLEGVGQVAVAVSGGSDSMALLLLLLNWASTRSDPPVISVLTVDHDLRLESAEEAKTVARWCKVMGVGHTILPWVGPKPVTGIQAKARIARYELMTQWCVAAHVPVLLTAHTADDQNETVIMRQRRTTSIRSLAGIWPARMWNGIQILRPVLDLMREDLRHYLNSASQPWLNDPSNDNRRFERVRVRQDLAGSVDDLRDVAALAQYQVRESDARAERWVDAHVTVSALGLVTCVLAEIAQLNPLEADAVLLKLLNLTGRRVPPERAHRLDLLAWLRSGPPSRRTLGGAVFSKHKTILALAREAGRIDPGKALIPDNGQLFWDGRFLIEGPSGSVVRALGTWGDMPRKDLPQFLRLGLPAAIVDGKLAFVPQLLPNPLFNCEFIKNGARG